MYSSLEKVLNEPTPKAHSHLAWLSLLTRAQEVYRAHTSQTNWTLWVKTCLVTRQMVQCECRLRVTCNLTSFSMSWRDFMQMLFIWEFRVWEKERNKWQMTKQKLSRESDGIQNDRRTTPFAWMSNLGWRLKGTPSRAAESGGRYKLREWPSCETFSWIRRFLEYLWFPGYCCQLVCQRCPWFGGCSVSDSVYYVASVEEGYCGGTQRLKHLQDTKYSCCHAGKSFKEALYLGLSGWGADGCSSESPRRSRLTLRGLACGAGLEK